MYCWPDESAYAIQEGDSWPTICSVMRSSRCRVVVVLSTAAIAVAGCSNSSPSSIVPSTTKATQRSTAPEQPAKKSVTPTMTTLPGGQTVTSTIVLVPNPNGDGSLVPCEGTVCTNPNHGGADSPNGDGPPEPGQSVFNGPADGPPEPGRSTFTSAPQSPPEPGKTTFSAPAADGPPEPGQSTLNGS